MVLLMKLLQRQLGIVDDHLVGLVLAVVHDLLYLLVHGLYEHIVKVLANNVLEYALEAALFTLCRHHKGAAQHVLNHRYVRRLHILGVVHNMVDIGAPVAENRVKKAVRGSLADDELGIHLLGYLVAQIKN